MEKCCRPACISFFCMYRHRVNALCFLFSYQCRQEDRTIYCYYIFMVTKRGY